MLRHYGEIGLLAPVYTSEFTGYRYYSDLMQPLIWLLLFSIMFGGNAIGESGGGNYTAFAFRAYW